MSNCLPLSLSSATHDPRSTCNATLDDAVAAGRPITNLALRDPDIRRPLHQWLVETYAHCAGTEILHEMKMPRPSARIDLAVINGELAGFEIKSDLDTLARLPRQTRAFNAVFERVCLVTTSRHVDAARSAVPGWWAIVLPSAHGDTQPFQFAQHGEPNPAVSAEAMLHVLYRAEVLAILERRNLCRGIRSKDREYLIGAVMAELAADDIKQGVRDELKQRACYSSSSSPK